MSKQNKKCFILIELLVVIANIAILTAMLLPADANRKDPREVTVTALCQRNET